MNRVVNPNARSRQHILLLKDSFQNPTTDYFTEVFEEVNVIDPRVYTEPESFPELLKKCDIDIVLFLYQQQNISEELIKFLQSS